MPKVKLPTLEPFPCHTPFIEITKERKELTGYGTQNEFNPIYTKQLLNKYEKADNQLRPKN